MTKLTNEALGIAGVLLSGAGLFFTFGTAPTELGARFGVSNRLLLILGAVMTVAGAGLVACRLLALVRCRIARMRAPQPILQSRAATRVDLGELHELYIQQFGDDVPSLGQMRRWHSRNPNIFRIVVETNPVTGARRIVASFKAVPLKNLTIAYLEMEALTGTTLTDDHIVKPRGKPSAWYVGDLVSMSNASAIAVMRDMVEFFSENLQEDTPIYARGLTEKGLGLLRDFCFEPVGERKMEMGRICKLPWNAVHELIERLHSTAPLRVRPRRRAAKPELSPAKEAVAPVLAEPEIRSTERKESEPAGIAPKFKPIAS